MKNTLQPTGTSSRMRLRAASAALALAVVAALSVITSQSAEAQTFTLLYSFSCSAQGVCPDGAGPGPLMQATDGNLYGGTSEGGNVNPNVCYGNGCGTLFNITTSGTLTTLVDFDSVDGFGAGALVQGTDGNFYGTTTAGGGNSFCNGIGCGTVFKFSPTGTLTTLYIFCSQSNCGDGALPYGALVQGTDGNFYGTTEFGGANSNCPDYCSGYGSVFKITPTGTLTTLYNFCTQSNCADGWGPVGGLIQATDGNFYGTTGAGGNSVNGVGTVFKITPSGTLTTLYSFPCLATAIACPGGAGVSGALVQGTDGNFYGVTTDGGANGESNPLPGTSGGTVFKITPTGALTTLYSFCAQSDCADGTMPVAGLIQATDGNFYGTTGWGGAYSTCTDACGVGTVFEITPSGTLTTLHSFNGADGARPGALVQDTDGNLYGTGGTIFSLDVSLGPFVKTLPTAGPALGAVMILGTDLTGATSVSFNGTAATFTVVSASLITTTVPLGATTGPVTVVTPNGTLTSNVPFTLTTGNTPTSTTLVSFLNPSTFNQSVTLTATVTGADGGTPTGTVTFTADGTNVLGMIALSGGQAALSTSAFGAGAHSIVASYGGDGNYQPSTSAALIQSVQMASSSLALASKVNPSAYNQAVTFTASISPQFGGSATGGVTFYSGTSAIGTAGVSGNKAKLTVSTLPVGKSGIQAIYSGDSNVAGSTSPVLAQGVTKASTTTAVFASPNPAFVGQTVTLTATVTSQYQGAVSGAVDFKSGAVSLGSATLQNGQATIETSFSKSGDDSITAKYVGDGNDTGSTSPDLTQVVDKYTSKTKVVSSLNPSMVGQEVTFTATVTTEGSPTGTVTFKSGATVLGKASLAGKTASLSKSSLAAGTYQIKAVYSGDGAVEGSTSPALKQVVSTP
jgi:uncharacterized repeat protein (TIGR03803 family)